MWISGLYLVMSRWEIQDKQPSVLPIPTMNVELTLLTRCFLFLISKINSRQLWSLFLHYRFWIANLRKQRKYSWEALGKRDSLEFLFLPQAVVKGVFRIRQNASTCVFVCGWDRRCWEEGRWWGIACFASMGVWACHAGVRNARELRWGTVAFTPHGSC